MAIASEIHSLEEINYKNRINAFLMAILLFWLGTFAFLSYYPFGDKLKDQVKKMTAGACAFDYASVRFEFFLPKMVIEDVTLPASCFNRMGAPVRLEYVNLGFRVISFSPLGIPFKLETSYNNQPLELFYVMGFDGQTIRMKDQRLNLSRFENLMGNFKLGGTVVVDVLMQMSYGQKLTAMDIKAQSNDFKIPAQTVMGGLNLPTLAVRKFYLETNSDDFPRLRVDKFIMGDPDSPVRMDLKGTIQIQDQMAFSPMKLDGELAFSPQFREAFPLVVNMLVNDTFTVKDGFYQVTVQGSLNAPQFVPR